MADAGDTPAAETDKTPPEVEQKSLDISDNVKNGLQERLKFFFCDANIRQDYFMRKFLLKHEGVPVDSLMRFNTITKHTKNKEVLLQVAREIEDLVVSDDGNTIRRKIPFTWENMKENVPLTLYVRNLPVSNEKYDVTTDEFKKLFDNFPGLVLVKLCFKQIFPDGTKRSKFSKPIKSIAHGSALVEFDTVEHLQQAADQLLTIKDGAEVDPTVKLVLNGQNLKVETLKEHEENDKKKEKDSPESKAKDVSVHEEKAKNKPKNLDNGGKRKSPQQRTALEPYSFDWKPKCVIKITGLAQSSDREAITEAVCKALEISAEVAKEKKLYVDFSKGQTEGAIRFDEPNEAIDVVLKKLESGDVLVAGEKVGAKLLEGDSEKEYWEKFIEFKNKQLKQRAEERSGRKKRRKW